MNVSRSPVFSRLPTDAGHLAATPVGPWLVPLVFVASALAHAGIFFSVSTIAERPQREKPPQVVRITDAKPPPPPPPPPPLLEEKKPEPPLPPKKEPPKERKPRVRQDERVKPPPPEAAPPPPEVRAGLSDSTSPNGKAGIAVAEGNSAELAVNPEDARKPPPPPAPPAPVEERYDPDAVVLTEAAVDTPSACPSIGEVPLSEDAINAGVTSGKVVVEVIIASDGGVAEVKLLQGTGYGVDADVVARYKKLRCKPGTKNGAPARSRRKIELPIEL